VKFQSTERMSATRYFAPYSELKSQFVIALLPSISGKNSLRRVKDTI
jgi:hypothetical protein